MQQHEINSSHFCQDIPPWAWASRSLPIPRWQPRRTRRIRELRPGAICMTSDGHRVFVVDVSPRVVRYVRIPIPAWPDEAGGAAWIQEVPRKDFSVVDVSNVRKGWLEDFIESRIVFREALPQDSRQTENIAQWFKIHRQIHPFPLPESPRSNSTDRLHAGHFSALSVIAPLLETGLLEVVAMDIQVIEPLFSHLAPQTKHLVLSVPSVDMWSAIRDGKRLTREDCRSMCLDFAPQWDGTVRVAPQVTDGDFWMFEIQGGSTAHKGYDWICDYRSLTDAVDLAALLRVSAPDLIQCATEKAGVVAPI